MNHFDINDTREWDFEGYWFRRKNIIVEFPKSWPLPVFGCTAYLCFVFLGRRYMEKKRRYELRVPMLTWSICLAIFSIIGALRFNVKIVEKFFESGFRGGVCFSDPHEQIPILRFWGMAFMYSKFVEYIDTAFIILRKQNLPFLHWYHHATVSIYCWYNYNYNNPGGYIFAGMNFAVHAIMYTYYSLRAAKLKPPKMFAMLITILQTCQMLVGCVVVVAMVFWGAEDDCKSSPMQRIYGIVMYATYLILFVNFFYQTYISNKNKKIQNAEIHNPSETNEKSNFVQEKMENDSTRRRVTFKNE